MTGRGAWNARKKIVHLAPGTTFGKAFEESAPRIHQGDDGCCKRFAEGQRGRHRQGRHDVEADFASQQAPDDLDDERHKDGSHACRPSRPGKFCLSGQAQADPRSETGKGDGQSLSLPLSLTLTKTEPAKLTMEPKLPALRGTAKSAFDYQVDVKNDGQEDTTVNLLSKAPDGFQVTFKEGYGSQELTSLPLKAGESKELKVSVQPPDSAQAGQYPVEVAAAAGNISANAKLMLDITGRPTVALTGPEGRLSGDATAGQERTFTFTLQNSGSAPARDVALSATPPSGWKVAFNPEKVDDIEPGQTASVAVSMTPSQQAIAGDYMVSVRANGPGASDSANFRVTVRTSTLWGVTGLAIIGIAVLVLGFAVARYGRR